MRAFIVLVAAGIGASAPLHSAAAPPRSGPAISAVPQPKNPCPPGYRLSDNSPYRPDDPNAAYDCVSDNPGQNPPGEAVPETVTNMFTLLATGARADTRQILTEMQQKRIRNQRLREAEDELATEMMRLQARTRSGPERGADAVLRSHRDWANQLPSLCGGARGDARDECLVTQLRKRESELRNFPGRRD